MKDAWSLYQFSNINLAQDYPSMKVLLGIVSESEQLMKGKKDAQPFYGNFILGSYSSTGQFCVGTQKGELLKYDVNAQCNKGRTACWFAAFRGHDRVVRALIGARASFIADNAGARPLHAAARTGHLDSARLLVELRSDINARSNAGQTACFEAAGKGHDRVVRALISAGATFIASSSGAPVYIAAARGHEKVIVTLANAKASIDEPAYGNTPISMAAYKNHEVVVRLLAHMGARLLRPDGHGFWTHYDDVDTRQRMRDLSLSIIRAGGNDSAPGQPVTGASLATRVALLNAAELYDPRVRVSREREELRKDYFVLSLLLDSGRATGADGEVMARLQVLPSELVREVIEYF